MDQPPRSDDTPRPLGRRRGQRSRKRSAHTAGAPYPPGQTHGFGPDRKVPPTPSSADPPPEQGDDDA